MTAVAMQVLVTGGRQVAIAAAWTLLAVACTAALVVTAAAAAHRAELRRAWRDRYERPALPAAVPCPCCAAFPLDSDDCTCREDCGVTQCQAADPPDHIEGCGPGRNMLAYPSLACPACDWIVGRLEVGDDTVRMLRQPERADDVTELLKGWHAEWERQKGEGRG